MLKLKKKKKKKTKKIKKIKIKKKKKTHTHTQQLNHLLEAMLSSTCLLKTQINDKLKSHMLKFVFKLVFHEKLLNLIE